MLSAEGRKPIQVSGDKIVLGDPIQKIEQRREIKKLSIDSQSGRG